MTTAPEVTEPGSELKVDETPALEKQRVTPLGQLASAYLAVLANERASSPHTLRAYERELVSFVAFILKTQGPDTQPSSIEHT